MITWDIFNELPEERKTEIIKEKDEILAQHWAVGYALDKLHLRLLEITSPYEDRYNKVDLKCENIFSKKIRYVQLKYANKNYGDIRVSQKELHAYYFHKNLTSYHIQIIGNQDWLNMNENLNICDIKILDSSFLQDLIDRNGLIGVSNYIPTLDANEFLRIGYNWHFYLNPYLSGKERKVCNSSCLVRNVKTDNIEFVFKSIPADNEYDGKRCYLIPDNLNDICNKNIITHISFSKF